MNEKNLEELVKLKAENEVMRKRLEKRENDKKSLNEQN